MSVEGVFNVLGGVVSRYFLVGFMAFAVLIIFISMFVLYEKAYVMGTMMLMFGLLVGGGSGYLFLKV